MKLKTLRIWLFLLPIIGIIGVLLYVQATNNQRELENQLLRSMEASKNDIVRALGDYYDRVDAYFMQHGASHAAEGSITQSQSLELTGINPFKPNYTNGRILSGDFNPKDSLYIKNGAVFRKDLNVNINSIINVLNIKKLLKPMRLTDMRGKDSDQNSEISLVVDIEIPISELLRKQETNKIFERFFLTDKIGNIVYPITEYGVSLFKPTDLKIDTLGITHAGASIIRIKFSEKDSRAYVSPIQINSLKLYAVGVISEVTHQKVGLRLNFTVLSILLLFLMVLIAMIPILGIMNLSQGDNLTQSKVTQVGISLLLLTVIIGFASAQFKNRPEDVDSKKQIIVKGLSQSLKDSLIFYKRKLEIMVNCDKWTMQGATFNELIRFRKNGFVEKIYYRGKDITLDFEKDTSSVDLSTRVYYSYFYDPKIVTTNSSIFLNSHYSRFDGELESVISKNFYKGNSEKEGVRAITFRLNTDTTFSNEYRFLVFKKNGKILLKSKKISSPIDNIEEGISPAKWQEISSIIENNKNSNQQISTTLYLNGYQYKGVLKKIPDVQFDQDIWMLFLVDTNLTHTYAALVTAESLLFVLLYFLSLIFSFLVQKNSRRFKNKYGTKSFLYNWLEPTESNLPHLFYLTISYGCYGILLLIIYYQFEITHIDFLVLMVFSGFLVSFINLSTSIGTDPSLELTEFKLKKYSVRALILGGIVLILFLWIVIEIPGINGPSLLLLLFSIGFILVWFFLIKPLKKNLMIHSKAMTLPLFLGVWFLVTGFLPGYFIMSKTQQFEQAIWDNTSYITNTTNDDIEDNTRLYEERRRNWLSLIADPFDAKIRNFIAPNMENVNQAMKTPKSLNPTWTSVFQNAMNASLFFILFVLLVKKLQSIIFFPIIVLKSKTINLNEKRVFLTCSDSALAKQYLEQHIPEGFNIQTIDLSIEESFGEIELSQYKTSYHFINFHCIKNQLGITPILSKKKYSEKQIIITSGKTWHESFSTLETIEDRVVFAEAFSEFSFPVLSLDSHQFSSESKDISHPLYIQAKNEEELQLSTAKFADIWSELNFQEKLVCHEFALERFLNKTRIKTILELFKKGILVEGNPKTISKEKEIETTFWDRHEFFSRLFQIYILTYVSEEEIKSFREFESKNGNSHIIQVSALSFVLICFALIGIFNRSFFDQIYAYLTGSIGLIGSLYTILNSGFANLKFGKQKA